MCLNSQVSGNDAHNFSRCREIKCVPLDVMNLLAFSHQPSHMTCCVKVIAVCIVQIGKIPVCCFNVEFICWQGGFFVKFQLLSLRLFSHVLNNPHANNIYKSPCNCKVKCPTGLLTIDMSGRHCVQYWPSFHKTIWLLQALEVPFKEGQLVIK